MKSIKTILVGMLAATAATAHAQVAVDVSVPGVRVQTGGHGGSSVAVNTAGTVDSDVQMEGVAIINGEVFIDGEKVPKGKTSYTSRKSGKSYQIKWGKNGNVSVEQK
ncbi:MAG: hypothetical protein H6R10_1806 [Rhodocyclaceae bacterium]|nr:hypothetical protein [Rhodocyclaceae bacterium]